LKEHEAPETTKQQISVSSVYSVVYHVPMHPIRPS
jgi:hypothetical protein